MSRAVICLLALFVATALAGECSIGDAEKIDCGYIGIDQSGCESKACCWEQSATAGVPWCYYSTTNGACYVAQTEQSLPFSEDEIKTMRGFYMKNININGKGMVAAAPTPNVVQYYYHWMRDGALSMRALQETNPEDFSAIEDIVKSYISWVLENQAETSPHGLDIRVEPKFNITTREVYEGQWCRPQNDGPGLRAMTLMIAADHLIQHGQSEYVKEHLWTNDPNAYHGGAIKYDLDYIVDGYDDETCDLWEEVTSSDFFWNRITMRRALIHGAKLATKMGDSAAAATYTSRAQTLNSTLYETHFVGGFLRESETRTMDGAVIIGLNDGYIEGEAQFSPSGYEVAATVAAYNVMFCKEYDINQQDTANGLPGVLYGRYQGDVYMGGNAWIMSTAALASVFYRAAKEIRTSGVPSQAAMAKWSTAFNQPLNNLPTDSYGLSDFFLAQGDGVLLRLRSHVVGKGFHLDEQLDRNTGYELSAKDLTWSYSEVFNAMHHRQQLF